MTQNSTFGPNSMKYSPDEVLSGLLATFKQTTFTDDTDRLGAIFKELGQTYSLLSPFAAAQGEADFSAVLGKGLEKLVSKKWLDHEPGMYSLTEAGRVSCVGSKKTLFNKGDLEQLEALAADFEAQLGA